LKTTDKFIALIGELKRSGFNEIDTINLGGGIGIVYHEEAPFDVKAWAREIISRLKGLGLRLIIEPGRYISGNSGILVVRVTYRKEAETKTFLITDGGMNDLIRPSLYGSYQNVWNCTRRDGMEVVDVVGPVCESGDFFAKDRSISHTVQGDYVAVMSAGAYCMAMASRYNSRRLPAEVMISENGSVRIIRRRDNWEDLLRNEEP
jgi:diaminopimelate decarboxylase